MGSMGSEPEVYYPKFCTLSFEICISMNVAPTQKSFPCVTKCNH